MPTATDGLSGGSDDDVTGKLTPMTGPTAGRRAELLIGALSAFALAILDGLNANLWYPAYQRLVCATVPLVDVGSLAYQVSLQQASGLAEPETNLGLTPGSQFLVGHWFATGWGTSTQCSHISTRPEVIDIEARVPRVSRVYFLYQGSWGVTRFLGKQIGAFELAFSDGSVPEDEFVLGSNIRDWAVNHPDGVNTVTDTRIAEALRAIAPDGTVGRMDVLTMSAEPARDSNQGKPSRAGRRAISASRLNPSLKFRRDSSTAPRS